MRISFPCLALTLLSACGATPPKSGWEYRPAHGAYAAWLFYRFADGEGTTLIGSCEGEPAFMISGGAWDGSQFSLTVGDKSWILPARQGEHGHYLPVDLYAPRQAIANAKRRIVFQVGSWRREIIPGPALTRFVSDCS